MTKAVATALTLALAAMASGATVRTGVGKMSVFPDRMTVATTGDLTFTFKADTSSLVGQTSLDVSRSWTPPQRTDPSAPGFVELRRGSCARATRIVSIVKLRVLIATSCKRGASYQLVYHAATAPPRASSEGYLFLTQTRSKAAGRKAKLRPLGLKKQPIVHVRGGPTTALELVAPSVVTSGVPFSVSVRALDRFGNNSTGYVATVTLKSTDSSATLPPPYAYGPTDVSQHTFEGVTLRKAGTQRLTATDSNGLKFVTPPITVNARN